LPLEKSNMEEKGPVALSIRNLFKTFTGKNETVTALDNVSLNVREGELFTFLGPSGCGKTTTLRCIAGFEKPTSGTIHFLGKDYTAIPPFRRNIGMVFQSYALFPHMSIFENVAYGLKRRKLPRLEIEEKVGRIIRMVGLEATQGRKPSELSGGQQQRIALARALVYEPKLLLLDEPLSNLDAKLRVYMREEIRRIQRRANVTTIYVTHDQEEALSISDKIAVMNEGRVSQVGSPDEIYENPCSIQVADFIGRANFIECTVEKQAGASLILTFPSSEKICLESAAEKLSAYGDLRGKLFIRPERMRVFPEPNRPNTLKGKVVRILYLGSMVRYFIEIFRETSPQEILVDENLRIPGVLEEDEVSVDFQGIDLGIFPSGSSPI